MNLYGISNSDYNGRVPSYYSVQDMTYHEFRNKPPGDDAIGFGGWHDAAFLIAAPNIKTARNAARRELWVGLDEYDLKVAHKKLDEDPDYDPFPWVKLIKLIPLSRTGIVYHSEGEC